MEYYQAIQNRAGQTAAVINQVIPALTVGGATAGSLLAQANALDGLAQARDNALADYDGANNAENRGFLAISALTLALPQAAEGELDDGVEAETALLDLLSPAYGIKPRTTELALERGKKLVSALNRIDPYLAARGRAPITSGGQGVAQLAGAMAVQPMSPRRGTPCARRPWRWTG